jgi:hypothetical protein
VHARAEDRVTLRQALNAGCQITSIQKFLGHKKLNTTMIYARVLDPTLAEDYFKAMERVEQRLQIGPVPKQEPEPENEVVNVLPPSQLLAWAERLALPELCPQERLELAENLKRALFLNFPGQLSPPTADAG